MHLPWRFQLLQAQPQIGPAVFEAFAESKRGPHMALTAADIYRALAAYPGGKPNTARTWADVNPALPAIPIQVYGPPATSGPAPDISVVRRE